MIPASMPARCSPTASTRRCGCRNWRWRTSCLTCSWSKAPAPICCATASRILSAAATSFAIWRGCRRPGLPVVTVTHGSSTAGGAYQTGLSDYIVMVRGRTRAFLAGPPLLKAATGRDRDRGGTRRRRDAHPHFRARRLSRRGRSRCAAHRARHHGQSGMGPAEAGGSFAIKPPRYDAEELLGIMPMDHKRPVDMRQVIARFVDDSDFTEFGAELRSRHRVRPRPHRGPGDRHHHQ